MSLIKIHLARSLLFPSLLCLDAPFVALGWAFCLLADLGGGGRADYGPVAAALFLSLWLIYLFDRLYDVTRSGVSGSLSRRHEWARRHRVLLGGLFVAALCSFLFLVLPRLDARTILMGLALGFFTGLYYFAFRFSRLYLRLRGAVPFKESMIALCFAGGILLVAGPAVFRIGFLPLVAGYLSLFTANCLLISRDEREIDRLADPAAYFSKDPSVPSGKPASGLPGWGALFASVCGGLTLIFEAGWIRSSSGLILCGFFTFLLTRRSGNEDGIAQPLADGIQLLPWLVLSVEAAWGMVFA